MYSNSILCDNNVIVNVVVRRVVQFVVWREIKLPPPSNREVRSSGLLRSE